ncbi:ABC-type microcin C transport system duplicated ATPase subunit YejF [Martelella radicis]|uniref:ABC-type microcin C transport system duplicated ATPase subunit YejF n=1 Tax=Martelella radicis TaxID=1397476 RepID=A0A7W6KNJ1_9HYPH|nr:ABC-type microcin C transport system duplicated ATPase subunit YejF [Martelella radicis]
MRAGAGYLFISHDLKVVRALRRRVCLRQHGKVDEQGPARDVPENPQTEYTKRLVKAAFEIVA